MLTVAYIRSEETQRQRKPSPQQDLHHKAVVSMAERREHDRQVANKMFGPERANLRMLERRLRELCEAENN